MDQGNGNLKKRNYEEQEKYVKTLVVAKEKLEEKMEEWRRELTKLGVGLKGGLIDQDGFPRGDVDLVVVRQYRHQYALAVTDLKVLQGKIEENLFELHRIAREEQLVDENDLRDPMAEDEVKHTTDKTPFMKINGTFSASPAEHSGLLEGDLVLSIGTIDASKYKKYGNSILMEYIEQNKGQKITIEILRNEVLMKCVLIPKEWSGKGLIGAKFGMVS